MLILKYLSYRHLITRARIYNELFNFTENIHFDKASKSFYYLKDLNILIGGLKGKSASVEKYKKYKMIRKPYKDLYTAFENLPDTIEITIKPI